MDIQLNHTNTYIEPEHQLRQIYDQRSRSQKLIDVVLSLFREIGYVLHVGYHRLLDESNRYSKCEDVVVWKTNSQCLYVLIHGLRGHPSIWNRQLDKLEAAHPDGDIFVPFVPKSGNCSLEEAGQPIFNHILGYLQKHPSNPVCLLGVSNGGRIATWIEYQLREASPQTAVKISTIAAVHFGSRMINHLASFKFLNSLIGTETLREELAFGSQRARLLLDCIRKACTAKRSYDFFATTEDFHVPDLGSSLPILNKGEQRFVIHGYGHNSIVFAVADEQITSCQQWIQEHQGKTQTCTEVSSAIPTQQEAFNN
jgi:hypothetical protein